MSTPTDIASAPRLSRFAWLMGLYAENHERVERLFGVSGLDVGSYRSSVGDGLDLRLEVVARHAYTLELTLSYELLDPLTGQPDPSAHLRVYGDARQAEATHCYVGRRWQDTLGLRPPHGALLHHRLRMNAFLNKWLAYLAEQGHGPETLSVFEADENSCRIA